MDPDIDPTASWWTFGIWVAKELWSFTFDIHPGTQTPIANVSETINTLKGERTYKVYHRTKPAFRNVLYGDVDYEW